MKSNTLILEHSNLLGIYEEKSKYIHEKKLYTNDQSSSVHKSTTEKQSK